MKRLWDRIEQWAQASAGRSLALRDGASPAAIASAERALGLALPAGLRGSLLAHDGQEGDEDEVLEWMPGCPPLASLDRIVARWTEEQGDLRDDNPPLVVEEGLLHSVLNHPLRIPIAGGPYWDGDVTYVDLFPGPSGAQGQLITLVSECDFVVLGRSFEEALETYVEAVESGAWVYDHAKRRVVPRDEPPDEHPNRAYAFARHAAARRATAAVGP